MTCNLRRPRFSGRAENFSLEPRVKNFFTRGEKKSLEPRTSIPKPEPYPSYPKREIYMKIYCSSTCIIFLPKNRPRFYRKKYICQEQGYASPEFEDTCIAKIGRRYDGTSTTETTLALRQVFLCLPKHVSVNTICERITSVMCTSINPLSAEF